MTTNADPNGDPSFRLDGIDPNGALAHAVGLKNQAMNAELVSRSDGWERGVRSVLLGNDRISIEVVVDRGLDIASARVRQVPVAWRSPTAIVAPWFVENTGFGPHRGFFGGLLTTCGFDHVGAPTERSAERFGYPARTTESLPMHGRASGTPARLLAYGVRDTAAGPQAFVEGEVTQVAVFGQHIVLTRSITIDWGSSEVRVSDSITNAGFAPTPLALLYHVNVGWPIVAPHARVHVAGTVVNGEGDPTVLRAPERGAEERVWMHEPTATANARGTAAIVNSHVDADTAAGLRVTWDTASLPSIVEWQIANVAAHYAVALEPTTLRLVDGAFEFPELQPDETFTTGVTIELLHGPAGSTFTEEVAL